MIGKGRLARETVRLKPPILGSSPGSEASAGNPGARLSKLAVALPLLVIVLSIPALRPLLAPGYPQTHDSLVHLFRVVELHRMIASGDFFPRWFPDFAVGYGYPMLNFNPPLTYYVAEAFHLVGFGFVDSVKLTIAASTVLAGLGMYIYVKYVTGSRSTALLASVAYMYTPYRLVDVYVRGAFTETVTFTFLPFALASFHALAGKGARVHLLTSALLVAALVLTHPVVMFFMPLLLVYALAVGILSPRPRQRSLLIVAAFALGFGASSFFWLPAYAEQIYVSADNFARTGMAPASNLFQFGDLLPRHLVYNYDEFPFKAGMAEWIMALGGLVVFAIALARRRSNLLPLLVFPAAAATAILLMSTLSTVFWQTMPLVNSIQFPWRLLYLVGLSASVCASFLAVSRRWGPYLAVAGSVLLILAATLSLPESRLEVPDGSMSVGTIARYEYDSGIIGTTYAAEWLPGVARAGFVPPVLGPQPTPPSDGRPPLSLVTLERTGPLAYRLNVSALQTASLRMHAFAFPGWQATVDGKAAPVYPSAPLGLVTVDVPAGDHTVDILFGDTTARAVGRIVSSIVILLLAIVGVGGGLRTGSPHPNPLPLRRAREPKPSPTAVGEGRVRAPLRFHPWLRPGGVVSSCLGSLCAIGLAAVLLGGLAPKAPPAMGQDLRLYGQRPLQADFDQTVRLVGFELQAPSPSEGWDADVTFYWQALRPMSGNFMAILEWIDPAGATFPAGTGWPIFATSPAQSWSNNEIVRDLRPLRLPEQRLRRARLQLTVWEDGRKLGMADLGTLDDVPPRSASPRPSVVGTTAATFGRKIGLVGSSVSLPGQSEEAFPARANGLMAIAKPGDKTRVTLSWQALSEMDDDLTVFVHLYDRQWQKIAQHDGQPQSSFRPTSLWQRGDVFRDPHVLSLPPDQPPGVYRLAAGFYNLRTMDRLEVGGSGDSVAVVGKIKISPRSANLAPSSRLDATFGGSLAVKGYDLGVDRSSPNAPGKNRLRLGIYWRVDGEVGTDYKVFVHLVDAAGQIVAQKDGEPVDGNYPTSYWAKGEEFVDSHAIDLTDADLAKVRQVVVGLYDPATGRRLPISSGADSLTIPTSGIYGPR